MVRRLFVMMVAVMLSLLTRATFGQEERPAAEHAMPGEHSAGEHGMHEGHGHGDFGMDEEMAPQRSQNFLMWFIGALGWKYTLLMPLSGLVSFVLTAALVIGGKGKTTGPALVFIVAIPFLIGLFGMLDGMISSFMVIAQSTVSPKPSVLAQGVSTSIVTPLFGMLLMVPSYLLATVGLTVRAFQKDRTP